MAVALLTSLLLAVTWTPGLALLLLKPVHATSTSAHESHDERGQDHGRVLRWHHTRARLVAQPAAVARRALSSARRGTYFAYTGLGSDLLPEMDEGGFILDYIMPAGSSLAETNRQSSITSSDSARTRPKSKAPRRRTGLQLGLAAVTEANTGDITVKLKDKRSRGIDEVMADVRQQIKTTEPELDVEFTQVLQDMIGDLSNSPEPIQIKLFTTTPRCLNQLGPRVAAAISKVDGVVDVQNGVDNTISGPATNFQVNPSSPPAWASRPRSGRRRHRHPRRRRSANDPIIVNGRPYASSRAPRRRDRASRSTPSRTPSSTPVPATPLRSVP